MTWDTGEGSILDRDILDVTDIEVNVRNIKVGLKIEIRRLNVTDFQIQIIALPSLK